MHHDLAIKSTRSAAYTAAQIIPPKKPMHARPVIRRYLANRVTGTRMRKNGNKQQKRRKWKQARTKGSHAENGHEYEYRSCDGNGERQRPIIELSRLRSKRARADWRAQHLHCATLASDGGGDKARQADPEQQIQYLRHRVTSGLVTVTTFLY